MQAITQKLAAMHARLDETCAVVWQVRDKLAALADKTPANPSAYPVVIEDLERQREGIDELWRAAVAKQDDFGIDWFARRHAQYVAAIAVLKGEKA